MYFLYSLLLVLGVVALLPRFLIDAFRHGKYATGLSERTGSLPRVPFSSKQVVWLHCVSVGETQAARPLVNALRAEYPDHAIVISTTTLTGQQLAREVFKAQAELVFYFPFDWAWSVRRALRTINPSAVLLMETEIWPRFLRECAMRQIPVAMINGRISEQSFRRYSLVPAFTRRVLSDISLAIMQTDADAMRVRSLGLPPERVKVSGNIKFDSSDASDEKVLTEKFRQRFGFNGARPLIVAASTHSPEERLVLDALKLIAGERESKPRILIAPRHPERFGEVVEILELSSFSWVRRSAMSSETDLTADVVLLDTIGELRAAYPLAQLVFVGGSIAPNGGHNVLEPAVSGRCIVTGAHTHNFKTIVESLLNKNAIVQLRDLSERNVTQALARVFLELLENDDRRHSLGTNARLVVEGNRGATSRTVQMLSLILNRRSTHAGGWSLKSKALTIDH